MAGAAAPGRYLTDDQEGHLKRFQQQTEEGVELGVGPEGEIYGLGKYQTLDLGWELVAGTVWLENLFHKHAFPKGTPDIRSFPVFPTEKLRIVLAGDFGTGNFGDETSPSTKISKIMASLKPHITIHLGDVYYAGTSGEETSNFLNSWPAGSLASFTLNSNHEMYPGGDSYFNEAVNGSLFKSSQAPYSFFAFEYGDWIVVGLDSAYNAGVLSLYMDGSLGDSGNAQFALLREIAAKGKKVIVLTHHNGFDLGGFTAGSPLKLYTEVMGAFPASAPPNYWYWGHKHAGAVYKPLSNGTLCRCVGHGALPWSQSSELKDSSQVVWYEDQSAGDPEDELRVFNGFALLELDANAIKETFYDELGRVAWDSVRGVSPRGAVTTSGA